MTDVGETDRGPGEAPDLMRVDEVAWREAERPAAAIRPLVRRQLCARDRVAAAAGHLGLPVRQVRRLVCRCRAADGALAASLPGRTSGGRGARRLAPAGGARPREVIDQGYPPRRRVSAEVHVREIRRAGASAAARVRAGAAGLTLPGGG